MNKINMDDLPSLDFEAGMPGGSANEAVAGTACIWLIDNGLGVVIRLVAG